MGGAAATRAFSIGATGARMAWAGSSFSSIRVSVTGPIGAIGMVRASCEPDWPSGSVLPTRQFAPDQRNSLRDAAVQRQGDPDRRCVNHAGIFGYASPRRVFCRAEDHRRAQVEIALIALAEFSR